MGSRFSRKYNYPADVLPISISNESGLERLLTTFQYFLYHRSFPHSNVNDFRGLIPIEAIRAYHFLHPEEKDDLKSILREYRDYKYKEHFIRDIRKQFPSVGVPVETRIEIWTNEIEHLSWESYNFVDDLWKTGREFYQRKIHFELVEMADFQLEVLRLRKRYSNLARSSKKELKEAFPDVFHFIGPVKTKGKVRRLIGGCF